LGEPSPKDTLYVKRLIIVTWFDLKTCMKERCVPYFYRKELHLRLQRLIQVARSVGEYFIEEIIKAIMIRFIRDLNKKT